MMYVNKRNGKVARLVERDEVRKTCMLEFEDGKSTTVASTTFKRWYKAIEEQEEVEPLIDLGNPIPDEEAEGIGMVGGDEALEQAVIEPTEEVITDDTRADGRIYAEIGKEIAEEAKQKAKDAKQKVSKKVAKKDMTTFMDLVTKKLESLRLTMTFNPNSPKEVTVKTDGRSAAIVRVAKDKCVVTMPDRYAPKSYRPDRIRNCTMANAYDISYQDLDKKFNELFSEILTKEEE